MASEAQKPATFPRGGGARSESGFAPAAASAGATLHRAFEAHVERSPEAVAVTCGEESLTYGELNRRANLIASRLLALGVRPDDLLGLCVERSMALIVGALAILKAGGAYVPLDPTYPTERIEFILHDAKVAIVVTQKHLAGKLGTSGSRLLDLLDLLDLESEQDRPDFATNPEAAASPDCLAYAIYTSGSTGQPKGVLVEHRNITRLFAATDPWFGFGQTDVWTLFHSYAFDFSVWEIWGALLYGGRLVIVPHGASRSPEALYRLLERERVTVLNQTPSVFRHLSRVDGAAASDLALRLIVFGGEALHVAELADWIERHGDLRPELINMYGITETTVHVTVRRVREIDAAAAGRSGASPIGLPIPDLAIHLLDSQGSPVPPGTPGEILVGGAGVSRGYLERPALTAERFVPDPFSVEPGSRLYRSGDLAVVLPDGELGYLGRIDRQVKIRGFRIELGEVEAALLTHPQVQDAAVIAREEPASESRLAAYVVLAGDCAAVTSMLRSHLQQTLPEPMIPAAFVVMDKLPLTAHGKLDRRALPAPAAIRPDLDVAHTAPRDPLEGEIAAACSLLLGIDGLGVNDNLLDLGAHSLLLTRLTARLRDRLRVEVPLEEVFAGPTVAQLARFVAAAGPAAPDDRVPLGPAPRHGNLPLSFSQERVWFLQRLHRANRAYHSQSLLEFRGRLRVGALEWSLGEIVRRHEIFRTTFPEIAGGPVQKIHPPWPVYLTTVDLGALPMVAAAAELRRAIAIDLSRPFDLAALPLVRWTLYRRRHDDHALLHVEHHLVHDGWSFNVFLGELSRLYRACCLGLPSPLPEPALQFADFALWQRQWMDGPAARAHLDYWRRKLTQGETSSLDLPCDRPRPAAQSYAGMARRFQLPAATRVAARTFSRSAGATLFMTLLAAFVALLHRYTGSDDVRVGSGLANRRWRESEGLIGMIINTLVLRTDLAGTPSFRELCGRVRTTVLEAQAHQDLPFEQVVAALRPRRDLSLTPLFQVAFSFHDSPRDECAYPELELEIQEAISNGSAKFDMNVIVVPRSEQLVGTVPHRDDGAIEVLWEYSTDLFDATTIARMADQFARLLAGGIAAPELPLTSLPLFSPAERHQLVAEWNDTITAFPRDGSITARFEAQAAHRADAVAVVEGERCLTYHELDRRANRLAHHLRALGVELEAPVGLLLERSLEAVVGLLGILKAGGAYLPLDPAYPRQRMELMLRDSGAAVVVTEGRFTNRLPRGCNRVRLDRDAALIAARADAAPRTEAGGNHLAYIVHTSGSTGIPKGVAIPHRGVLRLIEGTACLRLTSRDVFLSLAPLSFDACTFEIWACLLTGGCLAIMPEPLASIAALAEALVRHGVTTLWLTSGLFHQMVEEQLATLGRLDHLLAGGDVLSPTHVRTVRATHQQLDLINGYGPTESTTFACFHRTVRPERPGVAVPIGRPIANTRVYLLDARLDPVPIGAAGDLHIGGDGLARGYVGSPALTAARFLPDAFGLEPGGRIYRTGDRARLLPNGNIAFLGRDDDQVKVRGFRVELSEIERALASHPAVRDAVVLARPDERGDRQLVAYTVTVDGTKPAARALRQHLAAILPSHLIPSRFVVLDALPLTPNGKVDRTALPEPSRGGAARAAGRSAPRTALERRLASAWQEVLGLPRVGVHDDFFDLGGHSLVALRLVSRLRDGFDVAIEVRDIFEHPTIASLGRRLQDRRPARRADMEPRLLPRRRRTGRPTSFPLSFPQQRLWLLEQIEPGLAIHHVFRGFRLDGPLRPAALSAAVRAVMMRHEVLRTSFHAAADGAQQVVATMAPLDLPLIDVSGLDARDRERALEDHAATAYARPFDLGRPPLLRLWLVRLGERAHALLVTFHHLVFDGWSLGLFFSQLAASYAGHLGRGPEPGRQRVSLQYGDYAAWQRQRLRGGLLDGLLAYWRARIDGYHGLLELPADRRRPSRQSFRGGRRRRLLPRSLVGTLESLARAHGASLFMVLLAAFVTLLARLSGRDDLAVGCPVSARDHKDLEATIGFFVSTLALRLDVAGDPPFAELLGRVRESVLADFAHRELPFERLVEEVQPQRSLAHHPLVQVFFGLHSAPGADLPRLVDLEARPLAAAPRAAKLDLTAELQLAAEGLLALFDYSTDLFDAATVERMTEQFETLLHGIASAPRRRLSELPLLSAGACHQLQVEWNDRAADYPSRASIQAQFERQVERSPDALALSLHEESWTYRELNRRANRLAHYLRAHGVGPETAVGLCMERSPELVAAMLAVLKAGGFYLPLDPAYPRERLAFMLNDAGATVVVVERALADRLPRPRTPLTVVAPDDPRIAHQLCTSPSDRTDAENLAYVIYTSGSQGLPKGVTVSHRAVSRLVRGSDYMVWHPSECGAQASNTSFDAATFEIWGPLLAGARIAFVTREVSLAPLALRRELERQRVTTLFLTTALFNLVAREAPEAFCQLEQVLFGGEAVDAHQVARVLAAGAPRRLLHVYGPTESTTFACWQRVEALGGHEATVPIGRPLANTGLLVLDSRLRPVPIGVAGELCIGGDGLARGYWQQPALTAERFIPHPASGQPGARLYRTGDLVCQRPDGQVEFIERLDDQVKIRGFRVEPGEIESALRNHPAVCDAVVAARPSASGERRLIAYVVPAPGTRAAAAELRRFLAEMLPEPMLPAAFVELEALPLNANGKVDRRSLPEPHAARPEAELRSPSTPVERALAAIWSELLAVPEIGLDDNFFALGGHSLLAIRVAARVNREIGVELPLLGLFEAPTLAALSALVGRLQDAGAASVSITPLDRQTLRRKSSATRPAR